MSAVNPASQVAQNHCSTYFTTNQFRDRFVVPRQLDPLDSIAKVHRCCLCTYLRLCAWGNMISPHVESIDSSLSEQMGSAIETDRKRYSAATGKHTHGR